MSLNRSNLNHGLRDVNHQLNGTESQPETKPWSHWSVMFVHSDIADAKIPPGPLRLLAHLQRRIGERTDKNAHINPGIDSMARVCRMTKKRVIRDLRWLAGHGLIPGKTYLAMFLGRGGKNHRYQVLVPRYKFRIDLRLDDAKLSVAEFALVCYMANAADQFGFFFPAKPTTIAKRCGLSLNTVKKVLLSLLEKGYYEDSDIGENRPKIVWELLLGQIYPPLEGENVKRSNQNCQKEEPALSKGVTKEDPLLRRSIFKISSPKKRMRVCFQTPPLFLFLPNRILKNQSRHIRNQTSRLPSQIPKDFFRTHTLP